MTDSKKMVTSLGTIQYQRIGAGKPLLLVHGLFVSMKSFMPLFESLKDHRQLIAFDFPAHGDSSVGPGFLGNWQSHVDVVHEIISNMGYDAVDLCGHSMGGGVAAMFAGQYPQMVNKLVLIDSVTARFRLPVKGRIPQIPVLGDFVFKVLYGEKMFFSYFRNDVFFNPDKMDHERIHYYYECFNRNRSAILHCVRATANPSPIVDNLANIEADTLVLWGRQDPLIPLFVGNETVRKIKRASLGIIDDCGHSPMEECPGETARLIGDFLSNGDAK
ncbi:MAG: alpha/beta hydrolase [Deltaproteobacteria bacterium]|nr:alpha/beta hydrolase [Deltaproteobacteria bacterium]